MEMPTYKIPRPKQLNALNAQTILELNHAIIEAWTNTFVSQTHPEEIFTSFLVLFNIDEITISFSIPCIFITPVSKNFFISPRLLL